MTRHDPPMRFQLDDGTIVPASLVRECLHESILADTPNLIVRFEAMTPAQLTDAFHQEGP